MKKFDVRIMNSLATLIVVTGGTFDKRYNPISGTLGFDQTHVEDMLRQARISPESIRIHRLFLKDSLDLVEDDRLAIVAVCQEAEEAWIVIPHGTDTMLVTAKQIAKARLRKTIVLVGAMVPFCCKDSDAPYNLGSALTAARLIPRAGVYLAMHGEVFPWDAVRKNRELGRFEFVPRRELLPQTVGSPLPTEVSS